MTGDTILLVDADPETEEKIVESLESAGYIVFASEGGKVNAEMAEKFRPSLIFLRPLSPNAAGFAACRAIHNIPMLRDIPIVILAALKGPIDPRFTEYYGIVDFLRLTFSPEELLEKTATLVGSRQAEKTSAAAEQSIRTGEEVSAVQEVSPAEDEADRAAATTKISPAEVKNKPERFKEEWHDEAIDKITREDRRHRNDTKYTTPQYDRTLSSKRGFRKGPVYAVMALIAIIAAVTLLYLGFFETDKPFREVGPTPKPQNQQDNALHKADAPPSQPASSPPASVQATESAPLSPARTFYAAQIGAFKTERVAENLAQKFRSRGYEAYVQKGSTKDSSDVYRVLIGSFEKRKEAVSLAATVGIKEGIKTTVFQGQ